MSGGSFDYLFSKETAELLEDYNIGNIEEMADRLMQSGYKDVAKDMQRLAEYCKSANLRISVLSEELSDVMHAIEWCASGDWGEDRIFNAVEKYRNRGEACGSCESGGGCEDSGSREAGICPKKGQWIINSDRYYPYCSRCNNEPQGRIMTDYCPNCGAYMKAEEEENERG